MLTIHELNQIEQHLTEQNLLESNWLYVENEEGRMLEACGVRIKEGKIVIVPEKEL